MNDIFLLSVTHHTAHIAVRERLALGRDEQQSLLTEVAEIVSECVAIVTCNRTEVYGVSPNTQACHEVSLLLAKHANLAPEDLSSHVRCLHGLAVAEHLFRVAAGLDSLVIGEPQILGQVRQAADAARETGRSGPILERLFNYAVVTGKRARHETSISRGAGSISHAAVELARSTLGGLRGQRGLVIGLGEMGKLVARNLASHGLTDLCLCNRSPERSAELARQLHASEVGWDRLDNELVAADICITATAAREPILTRSRLEGLVSKRDQRPLLLIDIALPRDVESDVRHIPNIHLHDLDSLQSIREGNLQSREQTIPQVESITHEEVLAFQSWYCGRESAPVIQSLCQRVEAIRDEEAHRALRRLGHLNSRDRDVVMALSHAIANKMLHEPITRLKRSSEPVEHTQAIIDLFGLADTAPELPDSNSHTQNSTSTPSS